jgi:hypothetical protein
VVYGVPVTPLRNKTMETKLREMLSEIEKAQWMRDSCPYGCTGNKCPWCGAQQHISEHEHGCLVPRARAVLEETK